MLTVVPHLSTRWDAQQRGQHLRTAPGAVLPSTLTAESLRGSGALFSAVLSTESEIQLLTDHLRSWPLFYAVRGDHVHVGEDAFAVADALGGRSLDSAAAAEFLHTGFVLGDRSVLHGVRQVPAGTTVRIDRRTGEVRSRLERRLRLRAPEFADTDAFTRAFAAALDAQMVRLYDRADGRMIALPLSAGLDSRLLAALLARDGYPHVQTFTYGLPGNAEAQASARIAESLGLPWTQVTHTPDQLRRAWTDPSTASFLREASGGASLPHIQDWYAIRSLTEDGTLPPGSIVIPGHTVVSSAKDEPLRHGRAVTPAGVVDALRPWHFSLRSRSARAVRLPSVVRALQDFFTEVSLSGERRDTMDAVRWFWQRERQAKYILNSMRGYEHVGLEWALPMHELAVWEVYEAAPEEAIASREWYRAMTEQLYSSVSGEPAPTRAPRSNERSLARRTAATTARATGLPQLRSRLRTVRAVVDHPLGFDALITGATRRRIAARTALGMTPVGEFAELFLADRWVPGSSLFTSPED
ncbi:asparagine synthase-related protein [Brachybacterium sp.]|uniref:asparagine synthase-related protein n=1 Tax=Brachybacterium sp. TaxID=1891286 RepID=UPI002ED251A8